MCFIDLDESRTAFRPIALRPALPGFSAEDGFVSRYEKSQNGEPTFDQTRWERWADLAVLAIANFEFLAYAARHKKSPASFSWSGWAFSRNNELDLRDLC